MAQWLGWASVSDVRERARRSAWLATIQNGIVRGGTLLPQVQERVVRCVHMDSGCEMFGSVAVHCGHTDPFGALGRLDTGVVLAKNLMTNCFGVSPELFPGEPRARRFS
jgi:hypothetical protein